MKRSILTATLSVVLWLALALARVPAVYALTGTGSELHSNEASTELRVTIPESLTISVQPSIVTFHEDTADPGSFVADFPIIVNKSWNLSPSRTTLKAWAYFMTDPALSLEGGATGAPGILASEVFLTIMAGATPAPFDQSSPFSIFSVKILDLTSFSSQDSDEETLTLDMKPRKGPPQLNAGVYSGTLFFQAEAM